MPLNSSRSPTLPEETEEALSLSQGIDPSVFSPAPPLLDPAAPLPLERNRTHEAAKQLFCGGLAGSIAKTVTAPFSRLTILFQVHSLVTTKEHRPKFAMSIRQGVSKIIERGGIRSLWKGNVTSVLHRFPYSAINFYVYENSLDVLSQRSATDAGVDDEEVMTPGQLVRRMTKLVYNESTHESKNSNHHHHHPSNKQYEDTAAWQKFCAGAIAGTSAVTACYPLDLVRTRLTTELEGAEHYRGIGNAFYKIFKYEGLLGFYAGLAPTLLVAVPNFAISYTVYGTLKEYMIDDDLFYNLRKVDADTTGGGGDDEPTKLGFVLTVACGAASGILATLVTFPMDTIRRRMQVQSLHVAKENHMNSRQQLQHLIHKEGLWSLYRGLTPELLKVIPMVGTMFVVYEHAKDFFNVTHDRR
jgi:solute carrier family 25 (mitochondrial phosphate transporter), member 23/24/25/41